LANNNTQAGLIDTLELDNTTQATLITDNANSITNLNVSVTDNINSIANLNASIDSGLNNGDDATFVNLNVTAILNSTQRLYSNVTMVGDGCFWYNYTANAMIEEAICSV